MVDAQRGSSNIPLSPPAAPPATLLVIGRPEQWPALILQLAETHNIQIDCTANIHEAAARLALKRTRIIALLVEPEALSRHEWQLLAVLQRHIPQPVYSLPARARHGHNLAEGILPWEAAAQMLGQMAPTRNDPQGNKGISTPQNTSTKADAPSPPNPSNTPTPPTHNAPQNSPKKPTETPTEMPVVSEVATSYDESKADPLLSENEIRALLGP